jgi:hypothetical protein
VSPQRRISFWFGVPYLITFVTSMGALLFQPVLDDPRSYIAGVTTGCEFSLGIYPPIWGFKPSPILSEERRPDLHPALLAR